MNVSPLVALILVGSTLLIGWLLGWLIATRAGRSATERLARTMAEETVHRAAEEVSVRAVETLRSQNNEQMQNAMDTVVSMASSTLGGQLAVGREVISGERSSMAEQVSAISGELQRVTELVHSLSKERAAQAGRLESGLQETMRATARLTTTTDTLSQALASPKARGQWGERMAEDVLRVAGFVEGTNYRRQTKAAGGGIPDFTFPLPTGQLVHMDVKFPMDNYLRWLESEDDTGRKRYAAAFNKDVRDRVKELSDRSYVDPGTTVDYMLLFVPNESVYGFVHEHDGELIDFALSRKVVLCSPTTLFAVLAVIRQAMDNFMVDRRSDDILAALGELRVQWERWEEPLEKMRRGLDSAHRAFDDLTGARKRAFEKQLEKLEAYRDDDLEAVESAGSFRPADPAPGALRQVS